MANQARSVVPGGSVLAGSAVRVIQGDCGAPSLIEILMRAAGDLFRSFCFLVYFSHYFTANFTAMERAAL